MYFTTTDKRGNERPFTFFPFISLSLSLSLSLETTLSSADLFRAVAYSRGSRWNRFLDNSSARFFWWRTPRRIGSSREKKEGWGAFHPTSTPIQEGSQIRGPFISLTSGVSFFYQPPSRGYKIENEYRGVNTRPKLWIQSPQISLNRVN